MKGRTIKALLALLAFASVISVTVYAADPHPNFTGTWVIDIVATAKANGKAAQPGKELTQRDSGAAAAAPTLVMEMPNDTTLKIAGGRGRGDTIYAIDGQDHKTKVQQRGGEMELVVKAKWDGAKLVTTVTQKMVQTGELHETETKETRSLDKDGRLLYQFDRSASGHSVAELGGRGGGGGGGAGGGGGDAAEGMGGGGGGPYKAIYTKKQ